MFLDYITAFFWRIPLCTAGEEKEDCMNGTGCGSGGPWREFGVTLTVEDNSLFVCLCARARN